MCPLLNGRENRTVIPQIGVSRLGHRRIIGAIIAGLILTPDKTGVFRQRLLRLERIDPADTRFVVMIVLALSDRSAITLESVPSSNGVAVSFLVWHRIPSS